MTDDPYERMLDHHDDTEADWLEHVEWTETEKRDRLLRHWDGSDLCAICALQPVITLTGGKCRNCFDQQREEREAA